MRHKPIALIVASFLCFGFWQMGQAAYIPAKAWFAQELMLRAWQRAADGFERPRPWPWADTHPVARLSARDGDVRLIVLSGDSGRTLAFGPGHVGVSALPGERGNVVIAGHRDTHFAFLKDIQIGDELSLESPGGQRHRYEVSHLDVVDSRRGKLNLDADDAMLSLVTCYPFNAVTPGGPLRYVVSARLVRSSM